MRRVGLVAAMVALTLVHIGGVRAATVSLFADDFDRAAGPVVGGAWSEGQEGPTSFLELSSGAIGFHYVKTGPPASGVPNTRPIARAPLSAPVSSYPAVLSFTIAPHADERLGHEMGFMVGSAGMSGLVPSQSLVVQLNRSSKDFNNSNLRITQRVGGVATTLGTKAIAFQLESGQTYAVTLAIQPNLSAVATVSNGVTIDTLSSATSSVTGTLDEIYATDFDGSISFSSGPGDYVLLVDDVEVEQTVPGPGTYSPGLLEPTAASFEADTDSNGFANGWAEYINIGAARLSSSEVFEGTRSQRLVADLAGGAFAARIMSVGGSGAGGTTPIVLNQPYTFSYWFKAAPGVTAVANIKGYNSAAGEFGPQSATTKAGTGTWERIHVTQTFTAAGQVAARVLPGISTPVTAGMEIFVDAAEFGPDGDTDGILDIADQCPGTAPGAPVDANGCSAAQFDADGDGDPDVTDNCPTTANVDQADTDGDGAGDLCDAFPNDAANDVDGDGVSGHVDNCPTTANLSQANADGDAQGDACDVDDDNDGVLDASDPHPTAAGPQSKDDCKNGGWTQFTNPRFRNQGDCVSYVSTVGRNAPSPR